MSVYVDDMCAPFGRMKMCHMIADTNLELTRMAYEIGLQPQWVQKAGTYREHFDVSLTRRREAVKRGAIEISRRELATRVRSRLSDRPAPEGT